MNNENYAIRGGKEGYDRLKILSKILEPTTGKLFKRLGIAPGMRCLDVGCGTGDVSRLLAWCVKDTGKVEGWDIDEYCIETARMEAAKKGFDQIEFRKLDILAVAGESKFDVVYARFLLSHLPDPEKVIKALRDHLRPNGLLILEDVEFRGHFCYPDFDAFRDYVNLYSKVVKLKGGNANIGIKLPRMLTDARFTNVGVKVYQHSALTGDVKLMAGLTLENIGDSLLAANIISEYELKDLIRKLNSYARHDNTLMSLPRIVQTWGNA
jgi:ubiquinone/menaquinone biosynthesis C-methylase UbiE